MSDIVSFGEWVQTRRNQLHLSRPELARQIHCSPVTIKKIERDERRPSPELAQLLATHLQVPEAQQDDFLRRARGEYVAQFSLPENLGSTETTSSLFVEAPQHNLPQRLTPFIGRQNEMAEIGDLITQNRLIMLTGVGGIGKTNLSIQVGQRLLSTFQDGIWLVELAPVADGALVAKTAAYTLGLRESGDRPILESLVNYLRPRNSLLILDNCEHVIHETAVMVQTILQQCPQVKILATSREAFALPGEMVFQVPPLTLPQRTNQIGIEEQAQYEAIQLFVERATAVSQGFQLTKENVEPVTQICQQLDGIPLAIELAAARVKLLTTEQIASRLDDRFRLLTKGNRHSLPRQQTLRSLVDWSWELLMPAEQMLLSRLSVFAGGMELEAVENICSGDGVEVHEIFDLMAELVNKSLVIAKRKQGQETRYELLETILQYAQEKLLKTKQTATFRNRHLAYFRQLAIVAESSLVGPEQFDCISHLEKELDNIRAALRWALMIDDETGLQIINTLWRFWHLSYLSEGASWNDQFLTKLISISPSTKAQALWVGGKLNFNAGGFDSAGMMVEECLALYQEQADKKGIAQALYLRGTLQCWGWGEGIPKANKTLQKSLALFRSLQEPIWVAEVLQQLGAFRGQSHTDFELALKYLRESESIFREANHFVGLATSLVWSSNIALWRGQYDVARPMLEEAMRIYEQFGLQGSSSSSPMGSLGRLHLGLGNYAQARAYLEQNLILNQQSGDNFSSYWTTIELGYVALRSGDFVQAKQHFANSQRMHEETGTVAGGGVVYMMEGLASLALRLEDPIRALHIFAWTDKIRDIDYDGRRPPAEAANVARDMAILKEMLDEETFTATYAEGQTMAVEEAIDYALQV